MVQATCYIIYGQHNPAWVYDAPVDGWVALGTTGVRSEVIIPGCPPADPSKYT